MKKLGTTIFIVCLTTGLVGQDVIYTICGEKDGQTTYLDSMLFENLSNGTSLLFDELPNQDYYDFNLSTQTLGIATDITLPTEYIRTKRASAWKKENIDLHNRPSIFIIHKYFHSGYNNFLCYRSNWWLRK